MKYFLIAGEASGDLHAAALITALRERDREAQFRFLGGDMMSSAAGVEPLIHYREMAYMGFVEVVKHLGAIRRNFKTARAGLLEWRPDVLILIDYPSFNLKMAGYAKKLGIPVTYYISPKVWAWKQWRVRKIRRVVDRMLAIFPFEVDFYRRHGYEVEYVGNPSVAEIDNALAAMPSRADFLKANALKDKPYIALLPGSRLSEIRENLPVMVEAVKQFPQYQAVVAGAPGVDPEYYTQYTRINEYRRLPVVTGQTYPLVAHARAALVTSGTATLETALLGTPQVAMYQGGGSKLVYNTMRHILTIPYITLPNLVADAPVIPELLMHLCTADAAAAELGRIVTDGDDRDRMLAGYAAMRQRLGTANAPDRAAELIHTPKTPQTSGKDPD